MAPASFSRKNVRGVLDIVNVDLDSKRTALAALFVTPRHQDLVKIIGTRHFSAAVSAAAALPFLASISHQVRGTIVELRHANLTYLGDKMARVGGTSLSKRICDVSSVRVGNSFCAP